MVIQLSIESPCKNLKFIYNWVGYILLLVEKFMNDIPVLFCESFQFPSIEIYVKLVSKECFDSSSKISLILIEL